MGLAAFAGFPFRPVVKQGPDAIPCFSEMQAGPTLRPDPFSQRRTILQERDGLLACEKDSRERLAYLWKKPDFAGCVTHM